MSGGPRSAPREEEAGSRTPTLIDRREVPAAAPDTDHPEPPPALVVGQASSHGELLERAILAKGMVTEETPSVHPALAWSWTPGCW